mgnify:CR=1 FL=1
MYQSRVHRNGRVSSNTCRAVDRILVKRLTGSSSANAIRPRGLFATDGIEVVHERECLQRLAANCLDNQLSLVEERMLSAYLARLRAGSGPQKWPLPRVVRNESGQRRLRRRADTPGFEANN